MQKIISKFTVYFQEPFWVGVYERLQGDQYQVSKVTFGAEPKDCQLYEFLSVNWGSFHFSKPVKMDALPERKVNPKRMSREVARSLKETGIGTQAQQALKLQQEQAKTKRKHKSRLERENNKQRQYQLKQKKRKEKHKGH